MLPPSDSEEEGEEGAAPKPPVKQKAVVAPRPAGQSANVGMLPPSDSEDDDDDSSSDDEPEYFKAAPKKKCVNLCDLSANLKLNLAISLVRGSV